MTCMLDAPARIPTAPGCNIWAEYIVLTPSPPPPPKKKEKKKRRHYKQTNKVTSRLDLFLVPHSPILSFCGPYIVEVWVVLSLAPLTWKTRAAVTRNKEFLQSLCQLPGKLRAQLVARRNEST